MSKILKTLRLPGLDETYIPGVVSINGVPPDEDGNIDLDLSADSGDFPDKHPTASSSFFVTPSNFGASHSEQTDDTEAL